MHVGNSVSIYVGSSCYLLDDAHGRTYSSTNDVTAYAGDTTEVLPRVMHSQFGRFHSNTWRRYSRRNARGKNCPRRCPLQLPRALPRTVFAGLTAKRQRKAAVPSENPCVTEIDNYLEDPSSELSSLFKYPNILKLYVKLITGLPASAAVERLFLWVAEFSH
jgi:hypothetical protein